MRDICIRRRGRSVSCPFENVKLTDQPGAWAGFLAREVQLEALHSFDRNQVEIALKANGVVGPEALWEQHRLRYGDVTRVVENQL